MILMGFFLFVPKWRIKRQFGCCCNIRGVELDWIHSFLWEITRFSLDFSRIGVNVFVSLMLGVLYCRSGNEGSRVLDNYNLLFAILMHHSMATMMLTVLTCKYSAPDWIHPPIWPVSISSPHGNGHFVEGTFQSMVLSEVILHFGDSARLADLDTGHLHL